MLWGKGQDLTPKPIWAPEAGALDYVGWAAAGFVNESWQGIQFASKSATTASLAYSLFNNSPSHSLIGENTLFGTPGTSGGAVAADVGQVFSYFGGLEGVLALGAKGGKVVQGVGKVDEVVDGRAHNCINCTTRLDYSSSFTDDLSNFKPGYQSFSGSLDDDLILVQFHRSDRALGEGRSAAWWTTPEQGNALQTIDDVRQSLALPPSWGPRDAVSVAKVPKGAEVDFFKGAAARQDRNGVTFEGDGLQFRFKDFDESWIIDTRKIPGIGNE